MGVPKRVPSLNTQVEGKCRELGGANAIHRCACLCAEAPMIMHKSYANSSSLPLLGNNKVGLGLSTWTWRRGGPMLCAHVRA